jgi:hypothetical protein
LRVEHLIKAGEDNSAGSQDGGQPGTCLQGSSNRCAGAGEEDQDLVDLVNDS